MTGWLVRDTSAPAECEVWYRVHELRYAPPLDEWDRPCGRGGVGVIVDEYAVRKKTAKGVWLHVGFGQRFVLRDAKKRFACPTLDEAVASFFARKRHHLRILRAQLVDVEEAVRVAEAKFRKAAV